MGLPRALTGIILLTLPLFAAGLTLDFDAIATDDKVDDFYASEGVYFQIDDWQTVTGFWEISEPNIAVLNPSTGYMNVVNGFVGSLSFNYGVFVDSTVRIYDGLNGTGNVLASTLLLENDPRNNFDSATIDFIGIGRSVTVQNELDAGGIFGWDDVTFTGASAAVPAPATLTLFSVGLVCIGLTKPRKRTQAFL